ncbi:TonB family protein [Pseudoduganella albidiflava]|uniref:TonB family protein n=1 Tax=Pseudoduganella albidiflava TaxID=321983 RepID=A0A411WYN7_9BURK|nr:TonB family protein [Pseudoduganella albidiflava]QBI01814.1 TonB family protein [Pseudoduganella albidiflava]GGY39562.1 hypothetical protein GCM10007387_21970 [Pseudoduganella albidiflava]
MSTATVSQATLSPRENLRVQRPAPAALKGGALAGVSHAPDGGWLRGRGVAASAALHGAALLAAWALSGTASDAPPPAPVVELIRLQPEALKPPPPPPPEPEPEPEKPKQLTAARPAPVPLPVPKTVAASADEAETTPPPDPPRQVAPIGPVTPAPPAPVAQVPAPPSAPPAPRQIATDGIPTDYVNQVYARINRSTEYPREAKMRRQQGRVGYRLTLSPQGALLGVDIQTSGNDVLDEAARQAIQRAAPFPALPDLGGSSYLLAGNIVFKLN